MAANKRTRLYRIVQYNVFVYATTKKKAKSQFETSTGLKAGMISWSRYKKIKMDLSDLNK
jgi:hypothetical protein